MPQRAAALKKWPQSLQAIVSHLEKAYESHQLKLWGCIRRQRLFLSTLYWNLGDGSELLGEREEIFTEENFLEEYVQVTCNI